MPGCSEGQAHRSLTTDLIAMKGPSPPTAKAAENYFKLQRKHEHTELCYGGALAHSLSLPGPVPFHVVFFSTSVPGQFPAWSKRFITSLTIPATKPTGKGQSWGECWSHTASKSHQLNLVWVFILIQRRSSKECDTFLLWSFPGIPHH